MHYTTTYSCIKKIIVKKPLNNKVNVGILAIFSAIARIPALMYNNYKKKFRVLMESTHG